jgi:hypothetical protein
MSPRNRADIGFFLLLAVELEACFTGLGHPAASLKSDNGPGISRGHCL